MKRTLVIILAVLMLVSPLPDLAQGQHPTAPSDGYCPHYGVIFVGNNVVDLKTYAG